MISATLKGAKKLAQELKAETRRQEKALNTAIRVEGFRLSKVLKKEIRTGRPGGSNLKELRYISIGRGRKRKPLAALAQGVRYFVESQHPFKLAVGWVGPETKTAARAVMRADPFGRGITGSAISSKRWRWLAAVLQEGYDIKVTPALRRELARIGGRMSKRSPKRRYFFIRRSTRTFRVPPRPIIEPFWKAHSRESVENIKRNYKLKLAGQRI